MTVVSKQLFYERIDTKNIPCSELHYWEPNCIKSICSSYILTSFLKGPTKFFVPIYMLKLLLNYKKVNDTAFLKSLLMSQVRSTMYGFTMGILMVSSVCFLRKVLGEFYYYTVLFFPGIISGLSLLVESEENQIFNTVIFFNTFIEAVIRNLNYYNICTITNTRKTIVFMLVSATLMYLLENTTKKIDSLYFWIYTPPRKRNDDSKEHDRFCSHSRTCYNFCFEGFVKYFSLGYVISMGRKFLPKMGVLFRKPTEIFRIVFNKTNCQFGLFVGSYVGLYRFLTCYLNKTNKIKKKFHGLVAGLFSGLSYTLFPNLQILSVGITVLLQILYENISNKLNIKHHFLARQLLFMLCHGTLMHNKMFCPASCPTHYTKMIDACSSNVTSKIYEKIITRYIL